MRKQDRKYRLWKLNRTVEVKEKVRQLKREIQRKMGLTHWDHVNRLFVEKEGEGPSGKMKRFWSSSSSNF